MTLSHNLEEKHGSSRRVFLRKSLAGAAMAVPAGFLAACVPSIGSGGSVMQKAEAATNVQQSTTLLALCSPGYSKQAFTEIMNDEHQHVIFLQAALKSAARPRPTFKNLAQTNIHSFVNLSQTFENVGVGAYLMAAPAIQNKGVLASAGSILTIEARHAGFLDALLQKPLSPNGAFDKPMTQAAIVNAVSPFIASLNGGPDPSAALKNDTDILNFALLLEFLEAEFYSTNVPRFFS